MKENGLDTLYLRGKIQVETARTALEFTGLNPRTQKLLQLLLDLHRYTSDGENQDDMEIELKGQNVPIDRADIVASLDAVCVSPDVSTERRLASAALRAMMQNEKF
jgi:hypothetical protein